MLARNKREEVGQIIIVGEAELTENLNSRATNLGGLFIVKSLLIELIKTLDKHSWTWTEETISFCLPLPARTENLDVFILCKLKRAEMKELHAPCAHFFRLGGAASCTQRCDCRVSQWKASRIPRPTHRLQGTWIMHAANAASSGSPPAPPTWLPPSATLPAQATWRGERDAHTGKNVRGRGGGGGGWRRVGKRRGLWEKKNRGAEKRGRDAERRIGQGD